MFKTVDGWLWPASDTECQKVAHDMRALKEAVALCEKKRIAVQAGGNVGIWPAELAKEFGAVYTAEPLPGNFYCLTNNVKAANVIKLQCGFGNNETAMGMQEIPGNCGAGWMAGEGTIPVLRIDDLRLLFCDLIALDIEGMELNALIGAERTIRRCKPVILLEQKGHGRRFGYEDEAIGEYLTAHGYEVKARVLRDVIYQWVGND